MHHASRSPKASCTLNLNCVLPKSPTYDDCNLFTVFVDTSPSDIHFNYFKQLDEVERLKEALETRSMTEVELTRKVEEQFARIQQLESELVP